MDSAAHSPQHFCSIVPPHLLRAMASCGDRATAAAAAATLANDDELRRRRDAVAMEREHPRLSFEPTSRCLERRIHGGDGQNDQDGQHGTATRSEGGRPTGDVAVDEAYAAAGATFELLWDVFGRNSLDDLGAPIECHVHHGEQYCNAFWDGSRVVLGDGDGVVVGRLSTLDVVAHGLAHDVVARVGGLRSHGQSGALRESLADVIASMVKQFSSPSRQTTAEADWLIGAGVLLPGVEARGLRSLREPGTAYDDPRLGGADPQPCHMDGYVDTDDDDGGVHVNSGIPSRAFWLVASALGGYSWERAGQIWYEALRDHRLTADATFGDFAALTWRAARGRDGADVASIVADAWASVGVPVDETVTAVRPTLV